MRFFLFKYTSFFLCFCLKKKSLEYENCEDVFNITLFMYRGTDKSLARPGRKRATATKL